MCWACKNESAKFWLSILKGLRNRVVADIFITCVVRYKGIKALMVDLKRGEIREKFSLALELIEDCGKDYKQAPEQIKRAFNQAIFERILIGPDGETSPVYAAPYDLIFDRQTTENTDSPDENGTVCIADLLRKYQNTAKKLSHFLGRCFSKDFLVGLRGLEPRTDRL